MRSLLIVGFLISFGLNGYGQRSVAPQKYIDKFEALAQVEIDAISAQHTEGQRSLRLVHRIESPSAIHLTYQHYIGEIPVYNSELHLHYSKEGKLLHSTNQLAQSLDYANFPSEKNDNAVLFEHEGQLLLGNWKKGGSENHPTQYIEMEGERFFEDYQKLYFNGPDSLVKAKVFLVNPVNSAGVDYGGAYIDNKDSNSAMLEAELKEVEMRVKYRNDTFFLGNDRFQFRNVINPATPQVFSLTDSFFFNRSDTAFEDVNAFYHLSNYAQYVQDMGFANLLFDTLVVDATASNSDASAFDPNPVPKTLEFGLGGVDDAEDGEVVIHEMIHSLSTKASPLTVKGNDRMAMEEGNCDYLASSYSMQYSSYKAWKVFSWDGHNEYWGGFVNNSNKNYKTDRTGFRDQDREIWTAALMCIHDKLGRAVTDSLVMEHFFYQYKHATMPEMASIILKMDTLQNQSKHSWAIRTCFVDQGILEPLSAKNIELADDLRLKNTLGFARGEGALELVFDDKQNFTVSVHSLTGKELYTEKSSGHEVRLSPVSLSPGIYILKIEIPAGTFQTKIQRF